jgi:hypothetical protein
VCSAFACSNTDDDCGWLLLKVTNWDARTTVCGMDKTAVPWRRRVDAIYFSVGPFANGVFRLYIFPKTVTWLDILYLIWFSYCTIAYVPAAVFPVEDHYRGSFTYTFIIYNTLDIRRNTRTAHEESRGLIGVH